MLEIELSGHARDMLAERHILEEWVWRCVESPDRDELGTDGNMHYFRAIAECGGRILHVVVNPNVRPQRVVTLFFGRRMRRRS